VIPGSPFIIYAPVDMKKNKEKEEEKTAHSQTIRQVSFPDTKNTIALQKINKNEYAYRQKQTNTDIIQHGHR
jgi:hypothetical protein